MQRLFPLLLIAVTVGCGSRQETPATNQPTQENEKSVVDTSDSSADIDLPSADTDESDVPSAPDASTDSDVGSVDLCDAVDCDDGDATIYPLAEGLDSDCQPLDESQQPIDEQPPEEKPKPSSCSALSLRGNEGALVVVFLFLFRRKTATKKA